MSFRQPEPYLKQENMDLDPTLDGDARKKRRNRTTQSCLNCHTSKRKCDRKRPCGRCITLGLTGLCVYEVDDPAARDDPNVDEVTHLRSRIAELESLVRELRGKPHPRWVDNAQSFRNGDHDDRRSVRLCRTNARGVGRHDSRSGSSSSDPHDGLGLDAVKSEMPDPSQSPLYTMSPSYDHAHVPAETLSYFDQRRTRENYSPISPGIPTNYSGSPFTDDSSSSYFGGARSSSFAGAASSALQLPPPQCGVQCACVNNSSATPCLASLSHQLQNTISILRHLPEHGAIDVPCHVYRRITDLQTALSTVLSAPQRSSTLPTYSSLTTTASLPASLSHAPSAQTPTHHSADAYRNGHDWHTVSTPTYQTYTHLASAQDHSGMYSSSKNVAYTVGA